MNFSYIDNFINYKDDIKEIDKHNDKEWIHSHNYDVESALYNIIQDSQEPQTGYINVTDNKSGIGQTHAFGGQNINCNDFGIYSNSCPHGCYLYGSDDPNTSIGAIRCTGKGQIKCYDVTGIPGTCCPGLTDPIQIIRRTDSLLDNTFKCIGSGSAPTPDPSRPEDICKQYSNCVLCTNDSSQTITTDGEITYNKARYITSGDLINGEGGKCPSGYTKCPPANAITPQQAGICDLSNTTVTAVGDTDDNTYSIPICDAIGWNNNGCGDLNNSISNSPSSYQFKDGGYCALNNIQDIPYGFDTHGDDDNTYPSITFYKGPPWPESWCPEEKMCTVGAKCSPCSVAGGRLVCKSGPPGKYIKSTTVQQDNNTFTAGNLKGNVCSMQFKLGTNNSNACS